MRKYMHTVINRLIQNMYTYLDTNNDKQTYTKYMIDTIIQYMCKHMHTPIH